MSDQRLSELLEDAGNRIHVGPPPVPDMLAEVTRRRRLRRATSIIAAGGLAAAVTVGITLTATAGDGPARTTDAATAGPVATTTATPTPTPSLSRPPRPAKVTMRVVRHVAGAQDFRPYSGPRPPAVSEAAALQRGRAPDDYSLGLWDIGFVHEDSSAVEWHSVWIIAHETFFQDLNQLSLGPPPPPGATATPEQPRPGWSRSVTMIDARTGKSVFGLMF